jgi:hypothetical protein
MIGIAATPAAVILGLVPRICYPLRIVADALIDPRDKPEDDGAVVIRAYPGRSLP